MRNQPRVECNIISGMGENRVIILMTEEISQQTLQEILEEDDGDDFLSELGISHDGTMDEV